MEWIIYKGKRRRGYYKDGGFIYLTNGMGKIVREEKSRILIEVEASSGKVRLWVERSEISIKQQREVRNYWSEK